MSVNLTIAGTTYAYPSPGDENGWGQGATDWATAVSTQLLQRSGGSFTLTSEVNFGPTFGLRSVVFRSTTTNPAAAGTVRLARVDTVSWRNQANNADLPLAVTSGDQLTFNGDALLTTGAALTANRALVSDGSGSIISSSITSTQIGFLSTVASAVSGNSDAATLTNKTLTAPVISTISNTGTLTLPTSTDTLVGRATTDTLTNKTLTTPVITTGLVNGLRNATTTKSANFNFLTTDYYLSCSASSGNITGTLPAAAGGNTGLRYNVKKTDSTFNTVTVTDGVFTTTLNTQNESIWVESTGSAWVLVDRNIPSVWNTTTTSPLSIANMASVSYRWRRVGDCVEVRFGWEATGSAGEIGANSISNIIPTGLTVDNIKLSFTASTGSNNLAPIGTHITMEATVDAYYSVTLYEDVGVFYVPQFTAAVNGLSFQANDSIAAQVSLPITGWNG